MAGVPPVASLVLLLSANGYNSLRPNIPLFMNGLFSFSLLPARPPSAQPYERAPRPMTTLTPADAASHRQTRASSYSRDTVLHSSALSEASPHFAKLGQLLHDARFKRLGPAECSVLELQLLHTRHPKPGTLCGAVVFSRARKPFD